MRHLTAALVVATVAATAQAGPRYLNGVVAIVEGTPITAHQVRRRAARDLRRLQASSETPARKELLRRELLSRALDAAIDAEMLEHLARKERILIPPPRELLEKFAAAQKLEPAQLLGRWEQEGLLREQIDAEMREAWVRLAVTARAWARLEQKGLPDDAWIDQWLRQTRRQANIERRSP